MNYWNNVKGHPAAGTIATFICDVLSYISSCRASCYYKMGNYETAQVLSRTPQYNNSKPFPAYVVVIEEMENYLAS